MLWTFGKEKERISLGRGPDSCVLIVVRGRDQVREYRFADVTPPSRLSDRHGRLSAEDGLDAIELLP